MKTRSRAHPAPRPQPATGFSLNAGAGVTPAETRRLTIFAWCVAAAFACGLLFMIAGPHKIGDYLTETDFYGDYAKGARLIQQGNLLPSRYGVVGPGYEVALAVAGLAVRDLFVAAQLLSAAAMTVALLLWFFLLRRCADARVGLLVVLVIAANPHFFHYGYAATTDALSVVIQAGALYLLLARGGARSVIGAGVLAALAFLTRYNAIYLLPAGIAAIVAAGRPAAEPAAGGSPRAARVRDAFRFTAGFFAPVVPWVLYSLAHGGSFSFQLHHNIAYEVFAHAKGIPWDTYQRDLQPQFKTLWDVIRRDPNAVAARMAFNCWDHLRLDAGSLLGWPTAAAGLLGIALGAADGTLRRLWPLWAASALLFLTLVPAFHSVRYSLALLPFYATTIALAFASPLGALAVGRARRLWLKPALAVVPLGLSLNDSVRVQAHVIDQLPTEVLECAQTLRELKQPGDRLIARKWHVAFHAGVDGVAFPFADSLADLATYAHRHHVRWLYMSWPEAETRPQFYFLLDTSGRIPGLTARRTTWPHPAVLYEIGPEFGRRPDWFGNDTLRALHSVRGRLMIDGNDTRLLMALAAIQRARGDLEAARSAAGRAAALAPGNRDAQKTLGFVALDQGDAEAALPALQRAEAIDPGDLESRLAVGAALLQLGRNAEAAAQWRSLIERTENPEILLEMLRLYQAAGDREAERRVVTTLERVGASP